ncbi:NmrA-like family protein [Polychaeton citri CBS 116435]|uniref:NmrA-like family protein n=1 Tax=Polychaeton citri CBS 116435 TaxID=1314669 RepID=A0A9P4Q8M6_9PEZI|nr:NmrA-like family protein [Polychaeton citri CBS 116435]
MSTLKPHDILIFGATGSIGSYIAEAIINAKENFGKIGVFTSPGTNEAKRPEIQALKDQGAEIIVGNIDSEDDIKNAYSNYDTIVSSLGRAVIQKQIFLLQLAEASKTINYFLPSEYGTDIEFNTTSSPHEKPHQQKLAVRRYIRDEVRRLTYIYVVTGPYSEFYLTAPNARLPALGGFDPKAKKAVLLGDGEGKVAFTSMADTGKLVVAALKNAEAAAGKALKVNSFTATPKEILAEFEKQTGGGKWDVEFTGLEELKRLESEAWEKGEPLATAFTLRRIWTEGGTLYPGDGRDNGIIGEPEMETLEEQVAKSVSAAK